MSKLDDLLNNEYAVIYHEFKSGDTQKQFVTFKIEAKQQIKDLMYEIVGKHSKKCGTHEYPTGSTLFFEDNSCTCDVLKLRNKIGDL